MSWTKLVASGLALAGGVLLFLYAPQTEQISALAGGLIGAALTALSGGAARVVRGRGRMPLVLPLLALPVLADSGCATFGQRVDATTELVHRLGDRLELLVQAICAPVGARTDPKSVIGEVLAVIDKLAEVAAVDLRAEAQRVDRLMDQLATCAPLAHGVTGETVPIAQRPRSLH